MINARFMVTGKRLDNGETVTGYYFAPLDRRPEPHYHAAILTLDYMADINSKVGDCIVEVDPASVEPVAVKVLRETGIIHSERCPNCHVHVSDNPYMQKYCDHCGQRLDWGGAE